MATKTPKTTSPKLAVIASGLKSAAAVTPLSELTAQLKTLTSSSSITAEILAVAKDIGGSHGRGLMAADMAQLRDLAVVSQRIETVGGRLDGLFEADPKLWISAWSKLQNDNTLRRGLLRDLKCTRMSRGASDKDSSEGLGEWEGVL
jgi:hypothetical protein